MPKKDSNNDLSVSIVIPVYNEEHHLAKCLNAIAAQTEMPDEVIVVDNNSTDNSAEIATSYPFVKLLKESRQGVMYARNTGFDKALGDVIGRIDADTILPPDWTKTVKALLADPAHAAVTGPVYYYDMPNSPRNYWIDHQIRLRLYQHVSSMPFLFGSNAALRLSAWKSVKSSLCHSRSVHEDLDLAIHLTRQNLSIRYDKSLLVGVSSRRYDDTFKQFRNYMGMYLQSYRQHGLSSLGPRLATGAYWLGFLLLAPLRRSYSDETGTRSLKQLRRNRRARKNPMSKS